MAKVELEGKLTSGFPAMTATVQVHKRGPRNLQLKWIVENLIRAALVYGVNQALDYLKGLLQELLQRSLGNGGPGKENPWACLAQKMIFTPDLLCKFVQNCRGLQCSAVPVQPVVFLECLSSGLCSQCCKEFQGAF